MVLNISSLVTPWAVFVFVLAVVLVVVVFLTTLERKLGKAVAIRREKEEYYPKKLEEIKQQRSVPAEFLDSLDEVARKFFEEKFGISGDEKYADLIVYFDKAGKKKVSSFCRKIQEAFYAGEQLNQKKIEELYLEFSSIVGIKRIAKENIYESKRDLRLANLFKRIASVFKNKKKAFEDSTKNWEPDFDEIPKEQIRPENNEPKSHKKISSIDDLSSIKEKIILMRKSFGSGVFE